MIVYRIGKEDFDLASPASAHRLMRKVPHMVDRELVLIIERIDAGGVFAKRWSAVESRKALQHELDLRMKAKQR